MFRLRLLRRKDDGHKSYSAGVIFDGIRTEEKLKTFLMTDLMTYYVYRQLSDNYFANKSNEDEKKHLDDILKTSKNIALHYAGNPSGTPADQIAKRVENLVRMIRDEVPRHNDKAVTINPGNLQYYHDFFDKSSENEQIAVKVMLKTDCVDDIRSE